MKIKTELKLHVMYEGWKKEDSRHGLVNKQYIAGIMKPKEIARLRDARVFSQYDESKIKLRVTNGDGAKWTKGITAKGGIYQKDQFHIMQEIVRDVPIEYRNMGTQESQIFSKLKKRFCSGRKAFWIRGANALSKICVLSEKFNIDELETPIPIDTRLEDWIKEIEENVKVNKQHRANRKEKEENKEIKNVIINSKFMKEIMKLKEFSEMRCSF